MPSSSVKVLDSLGKPRVGVPVTFTPTGGGRVAALEIMGNSLRVKESIERGEADGKTFYEIIEASATFGWKTFDRS